MLKLSLNKIRKQGYELYHTFNNMLKFSANLTKEEGFIPNRMLARILQLVHFKSLRLNEFNCRHETNFTNSVYIKPVFLHHGELLTNTTLPSLWTRLLFLASTVMRTQIR